MSENLRRKTETPTGRNLRRMFSLVPLIFSNQGLHIKELQRLSAAESPRQLRQDLERLMLFGVPPFSPSDLITVYIDDDERVFLDFPHGLEQPLALTPGEWTAVQQAITRELNFLTEATAGDNREESLREILRRISAIPVELESADAMRSRRTLIQEALGGDDDPGQIEFRYRTLSSKEAELRRVDPWALVKHNGVSYLIGYCHTRGAPRFFHLERMEQLELLDLARENDPPADLQSLLRESPIFRDKPAGFTVELAFAPGFRAALERTLRLGEIAPLAPAVQKRLDLPADWLTGRCKVPESLWLRAILRGMGPDVVLISPEHLRESFAADLAEIPLPDSV